MHAFFYRLNFQIEPSLAWINRQSKVYQNVKFKILFGKEMAHKGLLPVKTK